MVVLRRIAIVLAVGLVVAACGGDDSGSASDPTTAPPNTTAGGDIIVAQEGDSVAVHYVGTLDDGTEFDASRPRGATLDFTIGSSQMISGFDQGVRGMAAGETKTIRIEAADAYGEFDPAALVEVDISRVPEGTAAGDVLVDPTTGGPIPVVSIIGEVVTLDLNHELAGEALTFEIEMVAINP